MSLQTELLPPWFVSTVLVSSILSSQPVRRYWVTRLKPLLTGQIFFTPNTFILQPLDGMFALDKRRILLCLAVFVVFQDQALAQSEETVPCNEKTLLDGNQTDGDGAGEAEVTTIVNANVNIEAVPGENVTLFSTPDLNWTSFECRRNLSCVVLFRQNKIMPDCCPQFEGRVQVSTEGNLSVVLTNVTHKDSGNYTCELLDSRDEAKRPRVFSIILKVADAAGHPVWIFICVVLCIIAVSGVVFGVVHRKKITE